MTSLLIEVGTRNPTGFHNHRNPAFQIHDQYTVVCSCAQVAVLCVIFDSTCYIATILQISNLRMVLYPHIVCGVSVQ